MSRVTSGIQAGWREAQTRPGRPMPGANVVFPQMAANSSNESDAGCHMPTHWSTLRARSTSHKAPYCQPRPSQTALSIGGTASTSVGDSARTRAVS